MAMPARAAASPLTTTVPPRIDAAAPLPALPSMTTLPCRRHSAAPHPPGPWISRRTAALRVRALPPGVLPRHGFARSRLPRPVAAAERGEQRDLLVGDGHGALGLGDEERLETVRVLGEPDRVRRRRQVAEAPVELAHGGQERLTQRGALAQL